MSSFNVAVGRKSTLTKVLGSELLNHCIVTPGKIVAIAIAAVAYSILPLQAQEISSISPLAVRPGLTNQLKISGSSLNLATEAWTSFSDFVPLEKSAGASSRTISLYCPSQTPLGIYPFHIGGTKGVSKWVLMMVDDLPTILASEHPKSLETAQPVVFPSAIEGATASDEACFFRWDAKGGERYSIEVVAHRLGSAMDPVLQILDANGKNAVRIYDEPGLGPDCRLSFVAPQDGAYFIKLYDTAFAGGGNYTFRLRLGRFPLPTLTYPLRVRCGNDLKAVELLGSWVSSSEFQLQSTSGLPPESYASVLNSPNVEGGGSFVRVNRSDLPAVLENEPNDAEKEANAAAFHQVIHGRFNSENDVDSFKLALAEGEFLSVRTQTRSLGAPCDLFLQLLKGGAAVAESNPATPDDAELNFTAKQGGEYILKVRELTGQSHPVAVYQIVLSKSKSHFQLACDKEVLQIAPGKSATLKITAARSGDLADIQLYLHGGMHGITVENARLPRDKNEIELKLTGSKDLKQGQMIHFKIEGRIDGVPQVEKQFVSTRPALKKTFPLMLHPPAGLDGLFTLAIVSE